MCDSASAVIEANVFDSNVGTDHGGGIAMHESGSVRIANNLFVHNHCNGNSLKGGGAIHSWQSGPVIVNNTFVENYVGTGTWPNIQPDGFGGAIHIRGQSSAKIINCVFLNNRTRPNYGNSVGFTGSGTGSITYCDAFLAAAFTWDSADHGEAVYHYYDAAQQVVPGTGCVIPGIDPALCGVGAGHYWLDPNSSLHTQYHGQTHTNDSDVPTTDIEGYQRTELNTYTDMGAYESDERSCQ